MKVDRIFFPEMHIYYKRMGPKGYTRFLGQRGLNWGVASTSLGLFHLQVQHQDSHPNTKVRKGNS